MNDLQYRRLMDIPVLIAQSTYTARCCALSVSNALINSPIVQLSSYRSFPYFPIASLLNGKKGEQRYLPIID